MGHGLLPADALTGIDKASVASRFNRSAETYDDHCLVQRRMADDLLRRLDGVAEPVRILELGCGTGYLTGLLASRFPAAEILAIDFAERMVALARNRLRGHPVKFDVADAEVTDFPSGTFDLIVSNAAIQWFDAPARTLSRLAAALRPGGLMRHSTFGPGTFAELKSVLGGDGVWFGLPLRAPGEWTSMIADAGLQAADSTGCSLTVGYPNASDFLDELRATGATWRPGRAEDGLLAPRALRSALGRYDSEYGSPEGVPVTYELLEVSGARVEKPSKG